MVEQTDTLITREISCVKFAMDVAGTKKTPQARAAHIADTAGADAAAVNAILVVLENLGFLATA